jgi:hypothetical protein
MARCVVSTHDPLSPKISWSPSCTLSANPGYFCFKRKPALQTGFQVAVLTLYKEPSAPTEHPWSKSPFLLTIAAIPQALNLAERLPMSLANARKNWRSARVVSKAKKCVKIPMIIKSSSVGSLCIGSFNLCPSLINTTHLSIRDKNAVSKEYDISILYVF